MQVWKSLDSARLAIAAVWSAGAAIIVWLALACAGCCGNCDDRVVITHWANGHVMTDPLLKTFAARFNAADYRTAAGKRIEVRPYLVNSGVIAEGLIARINPSARSIECKATGCVNPRELPDPTIVTPVADHWLSQLNYEISRPVVDLGNTQALATTWIGIATLEGMARCLGWPDREVGFVDIMELRADERGWERCPTARAEWGRQPLISFTDPKSSSSGRSMLYTLFAVASAKTPTQLTEGDVTSATVADWIKRFQRAVDHYAPDTLILNREIYAAPRFGHFFFIGEDNLVQLYKGTAAGPAGASGAEQRLKQDLVMIYPKEGATAHTNPAGIVRADWVSVEQAEAAQVWIRFLREAPQQAAFMEEGLRPTANVPVACPICSRNGLDPRGPSVVLDPNDISPEVRGAIARSWGEVKTPGVMTFVVDSSALMTGANLRQASDAIVHVLDSIDRRSLVGFVSFSDDAQQRVEARPLAQNRFAVREAAESMQPRGSSRLYDAIADGIAIADSADAEPGAIRGVVVLAGGRPAAGRPLHDLVHLVARATGTPIVTCPGFDRDASCEDRNGTSVGLHEVEAAGWALATRNRVRVFYVGTGARADLEVGRLLSEATPSSDPVPAPEGGLDDIIKRFSSYF
jgi:Ca-activated chloride channel homolog